MLQLDSPQFGEVTFDPEQVIEFPAGLPAFEELRRFLLLELDGSAIGALQSVDEPRVCFPVLPIGAFEPEYQVELTPEDQERLAASDDDTRNLLALAIVTMTESGPPTANLLAPVVIHARERRGVQSVRGDSRYSHEQPLAVVPEAQPACS